MSPNLGLVQPGSPFSQMAPQMPQTSGQRPTEHSPEDQITPIADPANGTRDLVQEVSERLGQGFEFDRHNREDAVEDMKFLAGDQWPEYARSARVNRPMLTVNKLPQFLHQVTNDIRQSAPVLKVTPVAGKQDPQIAKIYDGIISDIQYRSSAKHIYATAAYHAAACGIGHYRVITRYVDDNTFDQELAIELIPYPLAVYWDPAAVKPDRSDAMWCIVVDLVPRATFKLKYPNATETSVNELRANNFSQGLYWASQDYILVAEYWTKIETLKTIAQFQNGEVIDITNLAMPALFQLQMQCGQVVAKRQAKGYRVEQSLVTGAEVLSGPNKWPGKHLPIIPVIGDEVPLERIVIRHGLIRHARDPQQLYNFWRSASAEAIALAPKAPWLVTDKMIANHKADWDSITKNNKPYLRFTPDQQAPGGKPERIVPPPPPDALWREAQVATDDIKATTGIYDASLGARSNETSGIAIKQRTAQGNMANFHYADNLSRSLEQTGRILIDLIPKVYDNEREARMLGEDGTEQFVPINHTLITANGEPVLLNDLSVGRFDIRVVTGPSYATKRLEAADAILELSKTIPNAAPLLADIAVRNMDIPDAQEASQRLKAMLPPQALRNPDGPPPPPPNPLDNPVIRAETELKAAQAEKTLAEAETLKAQLALTKQAAMPVPPLPPVEALLGMQPPMPPGMPPGGAPGGGPGPMGPGMTGGGPPPPPGGPLPHPNAPPLQRQGP